MNFVVRAYLKIALGVLAGVALLEFSTNAAQVSGAREFHQSIQPLLQTYCFDCHGDGAKKGNVAFDEFKNDQAIVENTDLWLHALKNLRAGLMPPPKKPQPTTEEKERIVQWIKSGPFNIDPQNPDPGRVTIRRLNRTEYRNTIHDLLGINFDTQNVFPADDTGHGFDNIGDVLTLPPMLLEKYVVAANQIVSQAMPISSKTMREDVVDGIEFYGAENVIPRPQHQRSDFPRPLGLSYYKAAAVTNIYKVDLTGKYQLGVALMVNERYVDGVFDYNKCRVTFRVDGKQLMNQEYSWEAGKPYTYHFDMDWTAGDHEMTFELQPLTPDQQQTRSLAMQITSVNVGGPMDEKYWVQPRDYKRFFPEPVPDEAKTRRAYARDLLGSFARRAFRRPADDKTLDRLTALAESVYSQPGKTFEAGVAQGTVAVLASPRFLFRDERVENAPSNVYPLVDEYSLAARLSYFLWSSMPDEELLHLAETGALRKNLNAQVARLLKDRRSDALVKDFVGQWLRARDIENVPIEAKFVLAREENTGAEMERNRKRFRELRDRPADRLTPAETEELEKLRALAGRAKSSTLRADMTGDLRRAMRLETEKCFDHILRQDRSLLELLDADYTFLNETLAVHYGIPGVSGREMRLVKLPEESPRGGILTQGTMLAVTSNPTRTSPVKRGLYILDNILGTPPAPPPANIPPLEDAAKGLTNHNPTLRETLAAHREQALCSSCHNRMDPLGLALENFNAMGMYRSSELGEPIDATGSLVSGETFNNIRELKQALVKNHSEDFYRTVTEKLLIFALGRGLEYYDVETCDQIVKRLETSNGRPSALIAGVVESAPFQKARTAEQNKLKTPAKPEQKRADAGTKPAI